MKSNLKQQVAELQKDLNHQFKRIETLTDRIENYMVPRLQKLDKELVDLKNKLASMEEIKKNLARMMERIFE